MSEMVTSKRGKIFYLCLLNLNLYKVYYSYTQTTLYSCDCCCNFCVMQHSKRIYFQFIFKFFDFLTCIYKENKYISTKDYVINMKSEVGSMFLLHFTYQIEQKYMGNFSSLMFIIISLSMLAYIFFLFIFTHR